MKESCFKGCFCSKEGSGVNKVVMLNSFQHLHRLKSASGEEIPDQARDDNRRGFTLIELLVVVLIIGILAAVALPQYKLAVAKSRLATVRPLLASIKEAEELYYLENGKYIGKIEQLNLDASMCEPISSYGVIKCAESFLLDPLNGSGASASANIRAMYCPEHTTNWSSDCSPNRDYTYTVWFTHSDKPNQIECSGKTDLGKKVCATLN